MGKWNATRSSIWHTCIIYNLYNIHTEGLKLLQKASGARHPCILTLPSSLGGSWFTVSKASGPEVEPHFLDIIPGYSRRNCKFAEKLGESPPWRKPRPDRASCNYCSRPEPNRRWSEPWRNGGETDLLFCYWKPLELLVFHHPKSANKNHPTKTWRNMETHLLIDNFRIFGFST